jgi:hypothetical protein
MKGKPLYLRGVNRKKANEIVRLFKRSYQPPIECVHVYGKPHAADPPDQNVTLRTCKLCKMVVGHVA